MDEDEIADYDIKTFSRSCSPLAQLRENGLKQLAVVKDRFRAIAVKGVSIGISPRDEILAKYTREEINTQLYKYFSRVREAKDVDALVSTSPPPLIIIGEYSKNHRWHYHGVIFSINIKTLDKIKRRINATIGRCVTSEISYVESYISYCFKEYEQNPDHLDARWNVFENSRYVTTLKNIVF